MTGAWVDREKGLLSLIALELGVSSRLCRYLQPGEPVVVMGPTGTPPEIEPNENVLLLVFRLSGAISPLQVKDASALPMPKVD